MSSLVYFSVPLYKLFCDLTGFQGFNEQTKISEENLEINDSQLEFNVIFTSQVDDDLNWIFEATNSLDARFIWKSTAPKGEPL